MSTEPTARIDHKMSMTGELTVSSHDKKSGRLLNQETQHNTITEAAKYQAMFDMLNAGQYMTDMFGSSQTGSNVIAALNRPTQLSLLTFPHPLAIHPIYTDRPMNDRLPIFQWFARLYQRERFDGGNGDRHGSVRLEVVSFRRSRIHDGIPENARRGKYPVGSASGKQQVRDTSGSGECPHALDDIKYGGMLFYRL
jgi:hypothetical protein